MSRNGVKMSQKGVTENKEYKTLWDLVIHCDSLIEVRRLDSVLVEGEIRKWRLSILQCLIIQV